MSVANLRSGTSVPGFSLVKAPVGRMLVAAIHDSYGTLTECILELVQNGIDAGATNVAVIIDKRKRNIKIIDDGEGVSKEKYEASLQSVMVSTKSPDKYGQFGRGMLSPLKKCEAHSMISCPKGGMLFLEWIFKTEAIEAQKDEVFVPYRPRGDLRLKTDRRGAQAGVTMVEWQTTVEIDSYTDDRAISKIPSAESIFDALMRRYREKMIERNICTAITITDERGKVDEHIGFAVPYRGHRLQQHKVRHVDAGFTTFNLYLSRKNEKGALEGANVSVGETENPSRIPFRLFAQSLDGVLSHDVVEALKSGIFEGDILTERAKMHHNRKSFEPSNALLGFCESIEQWYDEVGKEHYCSVVEARDAERYKALGEDLSRTVERLLQDPKFADILKSLALGVKQKRAEKDKNGTERAEVSTSPRADRADPDEVPDREERDPSKKKVVSDKHPAPPSEHKRVARARVENKNLGIEFRYDDIYDEKVLWTFSDGVLTFNTLHAKWRACESSQRRSKQLQEFICMQALSLELMPEEWRPHVEMFCDEFTDQVVHLLTHSPNFQHPASLLRK